MKPGRRRVVVTGMDVVTPIGTGLDAFWKAALHGVSGARRIRHFDADGLPTQIAAPLDDAALLEEFRAEAGLDPLEPRGVLVGVHAARAAVQGTHAEQALASRRAGVYVGTSGERQDLRHLASMAYASRAAEGEMTPQGFLREFARRTGAERAYRSAPQYLASRLAATFGIEGPSATVQTACTSSAQAIGEASRAIARGTVDVALAGGADCIVSPIEMQLFCLLGVMSKRNDAPESASRPFDAHRDGFVMGEGAGFLVLEEAEHARRRGATVVAELAGYGSFCDAYRITDEAPDGRGAIRAMQAAIASAGLDASDIDYVNAHGTSTPMNDRVETAAIKQVFGRHAARLAVSSTKSMIGHTISAAGAIELIAAVLAVRDGQVPPTINYEVPDPDCDLNYVPNVAIGAPLRAAISNSFGFGGHNDCLLVRRWGA
ncbi:MAG: beta-ketoacyl-[acyl-carrier-protein] synthase family protein [Candidatus Rokubacteria bacterium]|nr:beta-ketoacyl-[acyl-carrier-protein] synthase family protein [Candidatus Rokubacteria bacterium]